MSSYEKYAVEIIDTYKRKNKKDLLILIPVYNEKEEVIAFLHPITADFERTMSWCINLLTKWREENPLLSPARFKVTPERTRIWIQKLVIENNNRMLFLIQNLEDAYIGHIGFASFDYVLKSAEVDSVLKGVKEGHPRLMEFAMKALVQWGIQILKLEHLTLEVLIDNDRAIGFYKRCGFEPMHSIPLEKIVLEDEIKWRPCEDASKKDAERYFLVMKLL